MSPGDQVVIKALPGNDRCMECGMKSPQWASVSFGTIFCLECSGVHRSLGVHISFVRSISMDSWTEPQLKLMRAGGNQKCASYLSSNGILPSTPIKAKYESRVAQHYKDVVKARTNGQPDPPLSASTIKASKTNNNSRSSSTNTSSSSSSRGGEDPNGLERLTGETDEQYIARQTRLRQEAKVRMAAKFGGGKRMGGVGSNSSSGKMAGIGSNSSYNPNLGGYGNAGGISGNLQVDSLVSGFGSALSSLGALGKSGINSASVVLQDQQKMNGFAGSMKNTGASLWSSLSNAANDIAMTITEPDGGGKSFYNDELSELRAHVQQEKINKLGTGASNSTKYKGFGSDSWNSSSSKAANTNLNTNGSTGSNVGTVVPNHYNVPKKNVDIPPYSSSTMSSSLKSPTGMKLGKGNSTTRAEMQKKQMQSEDFFSSFGT